MLDEATVKTYFRQQNTVVTWWNPEQSPKSFLYKAEAERAAHYIPVCSDCLLLDAACGKGRATASVAQKVHVTSMDISMQMLAVIEERYPQNTRIFGDAENTPFDDALFDVVICLGALVHMPDPHKAVAEFARILKPGGRLIISMDQHSSLYSLTKRLSRRIMHIYTPHVQLRGDAIWRTLDTSVMCRTLQSLGMSICKKDFLGILAPLQLQLSPTLTWQIFPPWIARVLFPISCKLDTVPALQRFAQYAILIADKKEQ